MQSLGKHISKFVSDGVALIFFKAFPQLFTNTKLHIFYEDSTSGLWKHLPVKMMFCEEIIRCPATLFRLLREYLVL